MDLNKIFIKDATPVKTGGQAVLDGIMMRGEDRSSVVVRLPDDNIHIKTQTQLQSHWLSDFFTSVNISGAIGFRKPRREIFEAALKDVRAETGNGRQIGRASCRERV